MTDEQIKEYFEKKKKEYEEIEELGRPLCIANIFVDHYFKLIFFGILIVGSCVMLVIFTGIYMPTPPSNRDYLDFSDIRTQMLDMREAAEMYVQLN